MHESIRGARSWAYEEFGHTELGDPRRTARLVRMAAALAERPGGKSVEVFCSNAEQQGAYDLLGNEKVQSESILAAVQAATLQRCEDAPWVHVVVDGTSLRLTDRRRTNSHRFVFSGPTRRRRRLRTVAAKGTSRGSIKLELRGRFNRKGRVAVLQLRTAAVVLDTTEAFTDEKLMVPVNVIEVREVGTTPRGEAPLHWRLLTNHPIATTCDVKAVVFGYAQRWKIEELHRVWKSGACRVEQSQLRCPKRVIKWTILAITTAARIERLRMLARTQSDSPADAEFTVYELRALTLMKRKYAKRTETIPDDTPSMADAVRWLADLGGHAGRRTSGPPGAVTIRRGLEFITPIAIALKALESEANLR